MEPSPRPLGIPCGTRVKPHRSVRDLRLGEEGGRQSEERAHGGPVDEPRVHTAHPEHTTLDRARKHDDLEMGAAAASERSVDDP